MGNTATIYSMIKNPKFYKEQVNLYIALGPVVHLTKLEPFIVLFGRINLDYEAILAALGVWELLPFQGN